MNSRSRRVHLDSELWVFCCCGCLPVLGILKALIFFAPPTLYATIATTCTAILFFPRHVYSALKVIFTTVALGRNARILLLLLLPFAFVLWLPLVFCCSFVASFVGTTHVLAFSVVYDDMPLLIGGVRECYKTTHKHVQWFWKRSSEVVYSFVDENQFIPRGWDGQVYDIPLVKVFIGLWLFIYGATVGLILSSLIVVIKFVPLLIQANYYCLMVCCQSYCVLFSPIAVVFLNALSPIAIVVALLFGLNCGICCALEALKKDSVSSGYWCVLRIMRDFDMLSSQCMLANTDFEARSCISETPAYVSEIERAAITRPQELLDQVYSGFLGRCRSMTRNAVDNGWITQAHCADLEPFVFLGIPAAALFDILIKDDKNMNNSNVIECSEMTVIYSDLRQDHGIVRVFWPKIMSIRKHMKRLKLSSKDKEHVRFHLIAGGISETELTDQALGMKQTLENDKVPIDKVKLNGLISELNSFAIDVSRLKFMTTRFSKEALDVNEDDDSLDIMENASSGTDEEVEA